jgi:hypothetical protein
MPVFRVIPLNHIVRLLKINLFIFFRFAEVNEFPKRLIR